MRKPAHTNYTQHPIGKLFPPIDDAQFKELCQDIEKYGLRHEIVVFEGKILDGWHRYRACKKTHQPLRVVEYNDDVASAVLFVRSQNLHRRHLPTNQRALLAAKLMAEYQTRTKVRESERKKGVASPDASAKGKASEKVAAVFGVSAKSVERAAKIEKDATPEIKKAVATGKVSLEKGAKIASLPKAKQDKIAATPDAPSGTRNSQDYRLDQIKKHWRELDDKHKQQFIDHVNERAAYRYESHKSLTSEVTVKKPPSFDQVAVPASKPLSNAEKVAAGEAQLANYRAAVNASKAAKNGSAHA